MSEMCDKCGRGVGSVGVGGWSQPWRFGWELCASCAGVLVACPIGDLVGEPHEFAAGSGRLAFLDIMGLAGNVHEVCISCAHPSSEAVVDGGLELASNGPQTRAEWIDKRVNEARSCCNGQFLALAILPIVEEFAELLRVYFAGDDE